MEAYRLIVKGSLGNDPKGRIHDKTKVFPQLAEISSYTTNETIYLVMVNEGMGFHKALADWFGWPVETPAKDGSLLHFTVLQSL